MYISVEWMTWWPGVSLYGVGVAMSDHLYVF